MNQEDLKKMNELLDRQETLGSEIDTLIKNHKKAGQDRKNRAYFEKRLKQLQDLGNQFIANNEWVQKQPEHQKTSEYFKNNYDVLITNLIEQYTDVFQKGLKETSSELTPANVNDLPTEETEKSCHATPVQNLIRRQKAMMFSLQRLLQSSMPEDEAAPSFKAKQRLWEQIQDLHFAIWESIDNPSQIGYDMDTYTQLETNIMKVFETSTHSREHVNNNTTATVPTNIQLPKINIPKFDGDYGKWPTFSDLFLRVVHEQPISPIQKMWYLKTNLTGEAERIIRHLSLTESNYDTAWNILKDRFNNKRVLASTLIQQILDYHNIGPDAKAIKGLHDVIQESLAALNNANVCTKGWDPLLLQILVKKLDRHTHVLYESSLTNPREIQNINHFLNFLEQRFQALESLGPKDTHTKENKQHSSNKATSASITTTACKVCNAKDHAIYYCHKFIQLKPKERYELVQNNKLCINCLRPGHKAQSCSSRSCKHCTKKHNSLLHFDSKPKPQNNCKNAIASASTSVTATANTQQATSSSEPTNKTSPAVVAATNKTIVKTQANQNYVLLATAKIKIVANNGQACEARAVLDAGSQVNLVSHRLINKLSISTTKAQLSIEGIGLNSGNSDARVNVKLQSCIGNFSTRLEAFVIPQIISAQPSRNLDVSAWNIPEGIELADPFFYKSEKIDVLIGAEHYHHLLQPEQRLLGECLPLLQNTLLGWIVIGKTEINNDKAVTCAIFEEERVSDLLEKFWKIDDLSEQPKQMTAPDKLCETHFTTTVSRNIDGRFIVRLPFADNPSCLGNSQIQAMKRFQSLEKKLKNDQNLQREYRKFMEEYESLGHMEKLRINDIPVTNYFIPHHCVLKPESTTTKLRVVFDASAKTSSGCSLNDILHKGPTVQSELFSILLRFRLHRFVFTADIEKMYRQILIHNDDSAYQLIIWRNNESENYQYFRLKTVTYGTTSAPYLATKCLQYLATQNETKYPLGAAVIKDDFYVDDCLSGANDITTAQEMQRQTTALLKEAGFKLRKWSSNNNRLLTDIPVEDQEVNLDLDQSSTQTIKTLGLIWLPKSDELCGRANISSITKITKRTVSSDLARIFDPLGLFGPVTVKAKIFMQQLWELKVDWDEELPAQLQQQWEQFRNDLKVLNHIKTLRHVFRGRAPTRIQIHTFVDSSEKAYGAAVYVRALNKDKTINVQLLCAKSRIAPMKKLTIPRLELCAAVLGAELTNRVQRDMKLTNIATFLWSDSTIVLSWIQSPSSTLHTFVSNRISAIHQLTNIEQWHHVSSAENPADMLSRGISPEKLKSDSPWFYGPFFLYGNKEWWAEPISKIPEFPNDMERRTQRVVAISQERNDLETIIHSIEHKNSFKFLQNSVAYLRRPFIRPKPQYKALSPLEIRHATLLIVRTIQASEFRQELNDLKRHKAVSHSSQLSTLAPFIDSDGIIRVGGRLESSVLSYDAKHPMVLPYNDPIVKLLFKFKHEQNKHCGIQSLLAAMRQNFWPIKGKIMARNTVHNCILCSKAKPKLMGQIMGNLPSDRVSITRPFLSTGIDYCGPIWIHYKVRGKKPTKAYVAVFCCFATKAVHLELVTDLTTNAFLGALNRFSGRRGRCKTIYCDNATNFVGAKNQLEELNDSIFSVNGQEQIIRESSNKGIDFKFIPPRAPHFGGLWEAAVKSAKYLLVRSISTASLTYEELETVIIGIEAILNSRPITPMSADPNDLTALTPGHFLIGEPLTAVPDPYEGQTKMNLVQRWELVSKLKHDFWRRWSYEYLNELQYRHKWKTEAQNLKEHDMVIIKDDNLPTMKWPIGRIHKVYRGNDGRVRVADIKTTNGICKRPLHALAPLPTAASINSNEPQQETVIDNSDMQQSAPPSATASSLKISIPLNRLQPFEHLKTTASSTNLENAIPYKRQRRSSVPTLASMTIIALLLIPIILATPITQQQFPNKPGIYFEGIGTVNRIIGEWKVITFFDLSPIQTELQIFQNGTNFLEEMCPSLQQPNMCYELVKHFKGIKIELPEIRSSKRRQARGLFNFVGNVANKFFGVLDSEYADDISKTIKQLNENDNILAAMIQNQTSIIDTTLNIMKAETEKIELKLNTLQKEVNTISKETADVTLHVNLLEIYAATVAQLTLLSSDLLRLEDDIFDALTGARHGKISPLLISPQQLQQEITKIKEHLPNSLHLPFNQNDVIHMYNLMSLQSGVSSDHIIFIICLPLTNNDAFNLYNIIPIPAVINDTMFTIQPETSLLAVTPHRDQYFALTNEDVKTCKAIKQNSNQLLCSNKQTTYHQGSQAYLCEINLLKNRSNDNCLWKETKSDTIWSPLQHTNQWIFGTKHATKISAVCNGTAQMLELQGSCLLTLQHDCTLKHSTATIQAHQMFTDTIYESHIIFGDFKPVNNSAARIILNGSPLDLGIEVMRLNQLQETIRGDKFFNLPKLIEMQNVHHNITSYAALLLIACTIIWVSWKLKKIRQSRTLEDNTKPTPAARFSIDPEADN